MKINWLRVCRDIRPARAQLLKVWPQSNHHGSPPCFGQSEFNRRTGQLARDQVAYECCFVARLLFAFAAILLVVAALIRTWASSYLHASVVYAADVTSRWSQPDPTGEYAIPCISPMCSWSSLWANSQNVYSPWFRQLNRIARQNL